MRCTVFAALLWASSFPSVLAISVRARAVVGGGGGGGGGSHCKTVREKCIHVLIE